MTTEEAKEYISKLTFEEKLALMKLLDLMELNRNQAQSAKPQVDK